MKRREFLKSSAIIGALSAAGCISTERDPITTTEMGKIVDYTVTKKLDRVGIKIDLKENRYCDVPWTVFIRWELYEEDDLINPIRDGFRAVSFEDSTTETIWINVDPSSNYRSSVRQVSQKEYWNETGDKVSYYRCPGNI